MILFKLIEVDLDQERKRIAKARYNKRQRKALIKLVDLFEAGEFQACLDHINAPASFPWNESKEYSEKEHIGVEIGELLRDMSSYNYCTQAELLKQAKQKLKA